MMISRVARVNSSYPYLENDPSSSLVSHCLHIPPWYWFSTTAAHDERKGRLVPKMTSARYGLMAPSRQKWS